MVLVQTKHKQLKCTEKTIIQYILLWRAYYVVEGRAVQLSMIVIIFMRHRSLFVSDSFFPRKTHKKVVGLLPPLVAVELH